jgi:hypothetical protein
MIQKAMDVDPRLGFRYSVSSNRAQAAKTRSFAKRL